MLWPWVYLFGTIIGGLLFYWLRCINIVLYGIFEIIVSLTIMYITYFPKGGWALLATERYIPPPLGIIIASPIVAFFASVYVFVRGCDNIGLQKRICQALCRKENIGLQYVAFRVLCPKKSNDRTNPTLLAMCATILIVIMIFAIGFFAPDFLNKYQTLGAGIIALLGALGTIYIVNVQVWQAQSLEDDRRQRQELAARALMPVALEALCDYSEQYVRSLLPLLQAVRCGEPPPEVISILFPIPVSAIDILRQMVEFAKEPAASRNIAKLISAIQIQHSRLTRLVNPRFGVDARPIATVIGRLIDSLEVYARASKLFDYARLKTNDPPSDLEEFDLISAAKNLDIFESQHPDLFKEIRIWINTGGIRSE